MELDLNFLRSALFFASRALSSVTRKRQPEVPYIIHPYRVGLQLLSENVQNTLVIAACYLHDVLEESNVSIQTLERKFGTVVTGLVLELSDPIILRAYKKNLETYKIGFIRDSASNDAVLISLADKIDNTLDLQYELKNGLILDISHKQPYYSGLLSAYESRIASVNSPVYDKLLVQYKKIVLELWG